MHTCAKSSPARGRRRWSSYVRKKHFIDPKPLNMPPTVTSYREYGEELAALEQACQLRLDAVQGNPDIESLMPTQMQIVRAILAVAGEQRKNLESPHLARIAEYQAQYEQLKRVNRTQAPAPRIREDLDIGHLIHAQDRLFRTEYKLTGLMRHFTAA